MLRDRRIILGAVGALTAALALTACGGSGYDPAAVPQADASNKPAGPGDGTGETGPAGHVVTKIVGKKVPKMGSVVMDSKGWIFYRFDEDTAKPPTSTCVEACADTWPPVLVKSAKNLPKLKGIKADKVGVIKRDDGGLQLTIGGWPMYRYTGDTKAGTWKGQGVGGTWFVATKDGKKNLSLLPEGSDTQESTAPSDDSSSSDDSGDYGDSGSYGGY